MRQLKRLGHTVFLVTSEKNKNEAWPFDDLEEIFFMPEKDGRKWDINLLISGTAHLFRSHKIDRVIALDDYDVWKGARLREEFQIPGMGETTARHFFDKLSMRIEARDAGIPIPGFTSLFNDDTIRQFLKTSKGPWLAKPRRDAGSLNIRKIADADAFWKWSEETGDHRHEYLLEEFRPGTICHVDSLNYNDETLFTRASQYLDAPFEVAHGGGIFQSKTMSNKDALAKKLINLNSKVLAKKYHLPLVDDLQAGIIVTLSKYEKPDYDKFTDPEIWWKLHKKYHIGFIFQHKTEKKIDELLGQYAKVIKEEYATVVPLKE